MKRKREKEGITTVYKVYCIHTYNVIKKRENSLRSGLVLYRYRTKYKVPVHKVLINYPRRSPRTNITLHYEGTIPVPYGEPGLEEGRSWKRRTRR